MPPPDIRYDHLMSERHGMRAGFVLVGGRSSRMGRDKALLPLDGSTLVQRVAARVLEAAGKVTLIGSPKRYGSLGYPVIADHVQGCGPLGGVFTALSVTQSDWNLIIACDMPDLTRDFLGDLLRAAEMAGADCLVPETPAGLDPLCAVYHRRCASHAESAIHLKSFKMHDFVSRLHTVKWPVSNPFPLANVNTPEEWSAR
jgi:molybdopterin-guanine dinucleotide biosynthesis protein A